MEALIIKAINLFLNTLDNMYVIVTTTKEQRTQITELEDNGMLPNKCDICGLRASYPSHDTETNEAILKTAKLKQCGITKQFPRNITASIGNQDTVDFTMFCVLSNLRYWNKPIKKCPDWQLKISDQLVLKDYLSIHQAKNNRRIAIMLSIWGSILTIINMLSK